MTYNRFVSNTISELQKSNHNPIFDCEDLPIVTLEEAVEQITPPILDIIKYVTTATEKFNRHLSLLTRDESAAIYIYSMSSPFSSILNNVLRGGNRDARKSWFSFLKLLITALKKLPSKKVIIYRGVNYDDTLTYVDNDVHIWWGINSCSMNPKIIESYLGDNGTLFVIDATHGKDISMFSAIPDEQEIILMPGTRVRKRYDSLNLANHYYVIHLEEISAQNESQFQSNYLFESIKQIYRENNRIARIMNPAKSFPIEQSYINLAIVTTKEQHQKEKQLCLEQHVDAILDSFEQIYGMKTPIEVKDIFKTCKNSEKQVLVFGRAGIGKSTFCRYVAYQWATNSYWSQYELLALIPLRRLTTNRYPILPPGQRYSLIDLIKKEVFSYELSEKEESLLKNQFDVKKTLWILDGYDEIIQNIPSHLECLFEQLLKTPHHIITSRPYLNTLSYDVQMEITGFTDDNIEEYVQKFFEQMKDESDDASIKIKNLMSFLRSNGSVWGVAHIPVNLELICSFWSNEDWSEKQELTLTTLYTMMTEWLCRRYLASQNINIQKLSEDEVYGYCQKELIFLESLAFKAMKSNVIIIRPSLLKEALNEAKMFSKDYPHLLNIGLLKAFIKQGTGSQIETKKDHYFIHLSFQEYFAARHLINTLEGSSPEKATEFIKYQKYNQRYALVFSFISGLLGDSDQQLCSNMFWNAILEKPIDLVGIRHMQLIISCLEAAPNKSTITRYRELVEWIAKCIQFNISTDNKIIFEYLSQSLKRAQSLVCDSTVTNTLTTLLQNDSRTIKQSVLSFISQLQILNPSGDLINSISTYLDDKNQEVQRSACDALENMGEKAATNEVISKLLSALEDENKDVRTNACFALGKMSEKAATQQVINKLISGLGHKNEYVRRSVCDALGKMGEKAVTNEVINKLMSALEDENVLVRCRACEAFGKMGEKVAIIEVINKLMNALEDENKDVRRNACFALEKINEKAVTNEIINKLTNAIGDENVLVRWNACFTLGNMGKKAVTNEVLNKLMNALEDKNENVRCSACEALGKMGEKAATIEVINKLISALEDENKNVRRNGCFVLGKMSEKSVTNEVINKLISKLGDENEDVRTNACKALENVRETAVANEVINKLISALEDENKNVRTNACKALGNMGEKAATIEVINKLMSILEDKNENARWSACDALGKIGEKAATIDVINKLMSALEDKNEIVRWSACEALKNMGEKAATKEVLNKLMNTLGDESEYVRGNACEALGKLSEKAVTIEVINKLMSALEDKNENVRWSACKALGKMGDKAATNEVLNKLMNTLGDESEYVRGNACEALGKMSEKTVTNEVINNLISTLGDKSEYVRRIACEAVGKMVEKAAIEVVPVNKLIGLLDSTDYRISSAASGILENIFSSPGWIEKVDPCVISSLCMTEHGLNCIKNISGEQLIHIFFTTKDLGWLSVRKQVLLLQGSALVIALDKVIVYGRKEPVELDIQNSELRQELINALYNQAEQLCLVLDTL